MEQYQDDYTQPVQEPLQQEVNTQNVTQPSGEPYRMPFADPVYETPHGDIYRNVHVKPAKKAHRGGRVFRAVICVVLALVLVVGSCAVTAAVLNQKWETRLNNLRIAMDNGQAALQDQIDAIPSSGTPGIQTAAPGCLTPGEVYRRNVDAVVTIDTYYETVDPFGQTMAMGGLGSGFIISEDGYVVSNYHVIANATEIEITTSDGEVYEAKVIGSDEDYEFALLKIEGEDLPYVTLGSSSQLEIGDQVIAIGNPLGTLVSSMTVGYISAKDRLVTTDGSTINMLQTDAAINSGNSGGPLFNMKGEVVGITTAKMSGTSTSGVTIEGLGFAVPIDDVISMIDDLQQLGYISGAYLGVMVMDVDPAAQSYGVPAGAFIDEVTPGYAAEKAGLQAKDVITKVDQYEIASVSELTRTLRKFEPGDTVLVTVYRSGASLEIPVTLDEKPAEDSKVQDGTYLMPGDEGFEEWYQDFIEDYFD